MLDFTMKTPRDKVAVILLGAILALLLWFFLHG